MADDSTPTIRAVFETREAADLAVEHLIRSTIFRGLIFLSSRRVTRTQPARRRVAAMHPMMRELDATRRAGEIEVSADIAADQAAAIQPSLGDAGALQVSLH